MKTRPLAAILALISLLLGCGKNDGDLPREAASARTPWFDDHTGPSGLRFVHQVETSGHYLFPESIGSGAAFLDFDNDGRLDVFLIHNVRASSAATNRLYHQQPDGHFADVSSGSGLEIAGQGNGIAVGDVNNDGLPEVLITEYDGVRLFLNQGNGRFKDVTAAAGLTNRNWSVPAAFIDYDRDGWLDLVIGNYLDFDLSQKCPDAKGQPDFCGPHGFHPTITRLFRNLGRTSTSGAALPRFEDVTLRSGLARSPGKAMQIVCADFNEDRWPDIFITDDGLPNRLFVNQRNGAFKDEALLRGVAYTGMGGTAANMGIAVGDVDGDGWFDLFVPHLAEENHTLWRQGPRGIFRDETARAGLLNLPWHGTGFGAVFADFDCDGSLDLAVANGLVRRRVARTTPRLASGIAPFWTPYAEPAQLFANDGQGRFRDISSSNPAFAGEALVGRGLACGDIDNDGGLDLLVTGISGPARLHRNVASPRGHWLGIRAIDPALSGRDAYGAEVWLRVETSRWQLRLLQPAYSYASSNDPRVHFGLGPSTSFAEVRVVWPDGTEQSYPGGAADRYLVLRKGSGTTPSPSGLRDRP